MGRWDSWMDAVLQERYADEENGVLAKELGVGVRTVERHASKLGLRKSAEFMAGTQWRASREALRWYEYMRITGQKVKRNGCPGGPFEKGHKLDEATENKRVTALQERSWEDRKRIIHGIKPIAKWKYKKYE